MSYTIYESEGLLLDEIYSGESGKTIFVFTPDFGILTLFAQGVREQYSKMRGSLLIGSIANFEFVEGREMKRLTGTFQKKVFKNIFTDTKKAVVYFHCVSFLKRVLLGETESKFLYEKVIEGFLFLEDSQECELEIIEMIIIMNILYYLGYWKNYDCLDYSKENLQKVALEKDFLLKEINNSIKNTHL